MKTLRRHLLPALFVLLSVGASAASISSLSDRLPDTSKPCTDASKAPESALKWAMSTAAVREIMGQPDEIKPMQAPQGKAEIWVFTRPVSQRVERIVVGAIPIMSATYQINGSCNDKKPGRAIEQKVGETIQYGNLCVTTFEKVEVLLFNDHYLTCKVSQQEVKHYN